jgi:DNA-directed RNA polymerase subunit RPC12/RpoP
MKQRIYPCLECGSEEVELFDSGYTTFNVGGGRCKKCKREVSIKTLPWNPSKEDLTQVWNNDNDPINRLNY